MTDEAPRLISEQRLKYEKIAASVLAGKASQKEAADAILKLCEDNERLAVLCGKRRAEADRRVAEAREACAREAEAEGWEPGLRIAFTEREEGARDCAERIAAAIRAGKGGGE